MMAQTTQTDESVCVFAVIAPHLGGKFQNPKFGAWIAVSIQTSRILKLSYHWNCCIDRNQILYKDKDHHVTIRSLRCEWYKYAANENKTSVADILNIENRDISAVCSGFTNYDESWVLTQWRTLRLWRIFMYFIVPFHPNRLIHLWRYHNFWFSRWRRPAILNCYKFDFLCLVGSRGLATARSWVRVSLAAWPPRSNRGPVALCTLGLGLLNPPSFRGR